MNPYFCFWVLVHHRKVSTDFVSFEGAPVLRVGLERSNRRRPIIPVKAGTPSKDTSKYT